MKQSASISALAKALCAAQKKLKPALKDATNPFFKSKYANFESIWEAARDPLTANGLSVVQVLSTNETGEPTLNTMLMHESGEWISGKTPLKPMKPDPQSFGSHLSYLKRYALAAMVGVVTSDEDDDANRASGKHDEIEKPVAPIKAISQKQIGLLMQVCEENGWSEEGLREYLATKGIKSRSMIPASEFNGLLDHIRGIGQ
jgi:hypothetical protein